MQNINVFSQFPSDLQSILHGVLKLTRSIFSVNAFFYRDECLSSLPSRYSLYRCGKEIDLVKAVVWRCRKWELKIFCRVAEHTPLWKNRFTDNRDVLVGILFALRLMLTRYIVGFCYRYYRIRVVSTPTSTESVWKRLYLFFPVSPRCIRVLVYLLHFNLYHLVLLQFRSIVFNIDGFTTDKNYIFFIPLVTRILFRPSNTRFGTYIN